MSGYDSRDFWPKEREGFSDPVRPAYAAVHLGPSLPRRNSHMRLEECMGAIVAGAGLCWAASILSTQFQTVVRSGAWPPGPLEACGLGVLIWIHAKWRRSVRVQ